MSCVHTHLARKWLVHILTIIVVWPTVGSAYKQISDETSRLLRSAYRFESHRGSVSSAAGLLQISQRCGRWMGGSLTADENPT